MTWKFQIIWKFDQSIIDTRHGNDSVQGAQVKVSPLQGEVSSAAARASNAKNGSSPTKPEDWTQERI